MPAEFRTTTEERDALRHQAVIVAEQEGMAIAGAEPVDQASHAKRVAVMTTLLLQIGWEPEGTQSTYIIYDAITPLEQLRSLIEHRFLPDAEDWTAECRAGGEGEEDFARRVAVRAARSRAAALRAVLKRLMALRPAAEEQTAPCGRTTGQVKALMRVR